MNIGIVCYASIGGSGIVATELGKMLASRGHHVHVLSSDTPFRLGDYQPGLSFHRVEDADAIRCSASRSTCCRWRTRSSRCRARNASTSSMRTTPMPHATAAYLARQILAASNGRTVPKVITTLHGTDITLLGARSLVFGNHRVLASSSRTA